MERINYSLKIHLTFHFHFPDTSNQEDADEIIYFSYHNYHDPFTPVFDHDDDSNIHYFLIYLLMMIYLMMNSKRPKPSRHFSLTSWLCQALAAWRLVSLPITKLFNQLRLLITHLYALPINITHRSCFAHSNCMNSPLMRWNNLKLQALIRDASCLCFFRFLSCHSQEYTYASKLHVVSQNIVTSPWTMCHVLSLTYVLWTLLKMYYVCLNCYIFLVCWFTQPHCS